jgi:plastocyanin
VGARRRWSVSVAAFAALAVAGCSGGDDPGVTVEMFDNAFEPAELTVAAGEPIVFDNVGQVIHNAIDVDGAWTTDLAVEPGESDTVTIDEPGTYTFYCSLHAPPDGSGGMAGTLTVTEAGAEAVDGDGPEVDAQATDDRIGGVQPVEPTGEVREVPGDYPTIQSAVDAADPGDLVLVGPGTYREQVNVSTEQLVIRGTDREQVVIDGEFEREMGLLITADGVAVENVTVRDVTSNAFYWDGVTGFRGSYLTAINGSTYGIYAFDSVDGVFEHSYASGSADGGYYVGQCQDCRTILNEVTAEWNGFGFSGTNASNSLYLVNSLWTDNGAGIVPNTLDSQRYAPSRGATIAGNVVVGNGNFDAPVVSATWPAFGNGIVLAGGIHHTIVDNLVTDHPGYGIATTANISSNFWQPGGNRIERNLVRDSGRADLLAGAPAQNGGECFADNDVERTAPAFVRQARPCDGGGVPSFGSFRHTFLMMGQLGQFPGERRPQDMAGELPEPSGLPQMPGGADAPVRPAIDVFATYDGVDLDAIERPDPDGIEVPREVDADAGLRAFGIPLDDVRGWPAYFLGVGWILPALALLLLAAVALTDTLRRDDRSPTAKVVWAALIAVPAVVMLVTWWPLAVVLTIVVSVAALVRPSPRLSRRRRWLTIGGTLGTLVLLVPALVVAGMAGAGVL